MPFEVLLTEDAQRDLEELYDYIAEHDGLDRAAHVLDRIEKTLQSLANFPDRGSHPKELLALGIREYRQAHFKPYRMFYRIAKQRVYVYLVADGRRDMQALLSRRLLRA
ncbi:MAG TPA: type II toxin-antitoxin system RelE/ParE family toxin [Burkholderiaceae bacterium]|nr:type II toxin-antitoxin system RelE/ParE family toxin [Burkholderiaceae bacterium]